MNVNLEERARDFIQKLNLPSSISNDQLKTLASAAFEQGWKDCEMAELGKIVEESEKFDSLPAIIKKRIKRTVSCWVWTGTIQSGGYGMIGINYQRLLAHRVIYEHFHGPIQHKKVIDHLCRNRRCVNPSHLEQVSYKTNLDRGFGNSHQLNRAKTHCKYGHEFSDSNTRRDRKMNNGKPTIARTCLACVRRRNEKKKNENYKQK